MANLQVLTPQVLSSWSPNDRQLLFNLLHEADKQGKLLLVWWEEGRNLIHYGFSEPEYFNPWADERQAYSCPDWDIFIHSPELLSWDRLLNYEAFHGYTNKST